MSAFFEPQGDCFLATELTRGPWDPALMHGGPPAALLAGALERTAGPDMQIARVTFEFLRPLTIGVLDLDTSITRPGRRVRGVSGSLRANGTELVRANALAIRRTRLDLDDARVVATAPPPSPDDFEPWVIPLFRDAVGYHTGMESRIARGRFGEGALTAWFRMRVALVAGATPSGLERVVIAADSSNGVSVALDLARYTFLNPDLTVCLHRMPAGEWVALDAVTHPEPSGIGLAESALFDTSGPLGRAVQTLVVERRP